MKRIFLAHRLPLILFFLLTMQGCTTVGPDYTKPQLDHELESWKQVTQFGTTSSDNDINAINTWWKSFNDPQLDRLVELAIASNLDLEQARSRVREARAQRGIAGAEGMPQLATSGSGKQQKSGEASIDGLYSVGFDAAWELDLFGRVKRSQEAAVADLEATVESLHDAHVSLLAEVALNYLDLRSLQNRLRIARGNADLQEETYTLVQSLFDAGLTSGLELKEAESSLANTTSQIPPIKTGLSKAMHRLAVLSGQKPGMLDAFLTEPGPVPVAAPEIAIGIPANLMRRRPDIRQAERKLAAQSARIGVAVAELYPRFTLSGVLSFQATDASNLFTALARSVSFGPSFQWNIFNAGSVRNNITVQNERQKQALLDYEKSVLIAIEEIENGMVAYAQELDRNQGLRQAAAASKEAVRLAKSMYKDGLRDFNHVLTTQKNLFSQEDQLAESDADISGNLIRLYKALGGGWDQQERL